eukprot:TRINITY_DN4533_c0_g3_i2.p1 TRINITY_DN4533_c0_g3~~TRINITY_DN4533_c0_g3_i2.p1  ORF type:complete len:286 (-),score=30.70 TRINITY_DN4533_c0_g3_i2:121-978(-)
MARLLDFSRSVSSWRSTAKMVAMVVVVCLFTAPPLAARRTSLTYLCGANSVDTYRGCKCHEGFRCVVVGSSNSCLTRGNAVFGWNRPVASHNEYLPNFCLDAYSAPCECRREPTPEELAMRANDDGRVIAAVDDSAAFWETYFTRNRGSPVPPGGPSGSSQARLDAGTSESSSVSSLRPIEVDEDFVKAHLASLPSSLRDEIMSSITCPISLSLTRDPVVAADGNTYDRESIMRAFSTKAAGQPIRGISGDIYSRTVVENLNVRRILAEFERLGNAEKERKDDAQ